jgi:ketosteroid isomerase-like protein
MATQRGMDEADIRRRVNELVEAIRAMDLESVTSICAPNLVSYDVGPVLRQTGAEAKRKNWVQAFAMFQSPLGYEIRDLEITVGDGVAFGHSVNRLSGTTKNGQRSDVWVRWTACFRKIDGNWLMVHDHVSVPFDPGSGKALLDLEP